MHSSQTAERPQAQPSSLQHAVSPGPAHHCAPLRPLAFALLHFALLAAMYGAAAINARGHELAAQEVGAGRVVHLGQMTLRPVAGQGARP